MGFEQLVRYKFNNILSLRFHKISLERRRNIVWKKLRFQNIFPQTKLITSLKSPVELVHEPNEFFRLNYPFYRNFGFVFNKSEFQFQISVSLRSKKKWTHLCSTLDRYFPYIILKWSVLNNIGVNSSKD